MARVGGRAGVSAVRRRHPTSDIRHTNTVHPTFDIHHITSSIHRHSSMNDQYCFTSNLQNSCEDELDSSTFVFLQRCGNIMFGRGRNRNLSE